MEFLPYIYLGYMFISLYMLSMFLMIYLKNRKEIFSYPEAKRKYTVSFIVPAFLTSNLSTKQKPALGNVPENVVLISLIVPLPKDDPKRRCPDTSKLEKLVKWKPTVTFEEGLERTIKWFSQGKNLVV